MLRKHLGIERWLLFGGSWGSTLALAYAQAHPDRIRGLVLRGVFLGRPSEVEWFLHGLAAVFPDAHAAFVGHLTVEERQDVLGSYLKRLTSGDPAVHMTAARAWSVYEGVLLNATAQPGYGVVVCAGSECVGAGADRGALFCA